MSGFDAVLLREVSDWQRNTVRLLIRERWTWPGGNYLMSDGTWKQIEDGALNDDSGLVLPAGSVEAIAVAVQEFQGHASHADTEARVLREWLAVERDRVDRSLATRLQDSTR